MHKLLLHVRTKIHAQGYGAARRGHAQPYYRLAEAFHNEEEKRGGGWAYMQDEATTTAESKQHIMVRDSEGRV